ncbi:Uncharacterized [Syntrophomonas zehnderi OL-4]|uniref:Uncharacterized n=1 Tax=Syntrophomonas zehnderi OL-4 TaxID=690567 RepID=A0A0E4C915_9FIRM|nr:hypothetical protein [Syntrophomonas zehnderi]CFX77896.1 Uncharacterized [Syntrophomonas zehnderi OL-4]
MSNKDLIANSVGSFREKIDQARNSDNAGGEIHSAVQELLKEINANYPQIAYTPDKIEANIKKGMENFKSGIRQLDNEDGSIPEGVRYMLENFKNFHKK